MEQKQSENIRYLKDEELESRLKYLIGRERQLLHLILNHIQEVDRRKLYAARAFSSLHDYLTKVFGYSSSAAQRRIQAARLMTQIPHLSEQIQNGDVNLSQIGVIMHAVKTKESQSGEKISVETKQEILSEICLKSTATTQVLVAQKLDLPLQQPEKKVFQKDQSCVLTITLTADQLKKLQRCKGLLASKVQQQNKGFTTVDFLEELMDFYLSKKDPCTFSEKRSSQPLAQKRQLFQSWKCCQFLDPLTGRRCQETFQLEMEHLQPRWAGGKDHLPNRTLLCRTHNQWKYRQQSGRN